MGQMILTNNFFNAINHENCAVKYYDADSAPTAFSNDPSVDDGRNLICMNVTYATYGNTHPYGYGGYVTHEKGHSKLIRICDRGFAHGCEGEPTVHKIERYDSTLTKELQSNEWAAIMQLMPSIAFSYDVDRTWATGFNPFNFIASGVVEGSLVYPCFFPMLLESDEVFSKSTVDFDGNALLLDRDYASLINTSGGCFKRTPANGKNVLTFDFDYPVNGPTGPYNLPDFTVKGAALSLMTFNVSETNSMASSRLQVAIPIFAGINFDSPITVSGGDTVRLTLKLGATYEEK